MADRELLDLHIARVAFLATCERRLWRDLHAEPRRANGHQRVQAEEPWRVREARLAASLYASVGEGEDRVTWSFLTPASLDAVLARGVVITNAFVAGLFEIGGHRVRLRGLVRSIEPTADGTAVVLTDARRKPADQAWQQVALAGLVVEAIRDIEVREIALANGGTRESRLLDVDARDAAMGSLASAVRVARMVTEPWAPIGSWCRNCRHRAYCHDLADRERDVSLVGELPAATAHALHSGGVRTVDDLAALAPSALAPLPATAKARVGESRAGRLISRATAHATRRPQAVGGHVSLRDRLAGKTAVAFDVETDHTGDVVLWGLRVAGEPDSRILAGGSGEEAEHEGWERFLAAVEELSAGDDELAVLHWGAYDRTQLTRCLELYGGMAAGGVEDLLVDLFSHVRSLALPTKSYSQKSVETLAGFNRTLPDRDGLWAANRLTEARSVRSKAERKRALRDVIAYLNEDLAGLETICRWLLLNDL